MRTPRSLFAYGAWANTHVFDLRAGGEPRLLGEAAGGTLRGLDVPDLDDAGMVEAQQPRAA